MFSYLKLGRMFIYSREQQLHSRIKDEGEQFVVHKYDVMRHHWETKNGKNNKNRNIRKE